MTEPAGSDDWAELRETVGRKALDKLLHASSQHEEGDLTDRDLELIADTLYDLIVGVVPMEVADVVYAVRQDLRK